MSTSQWSLRGADRELTDQFQRARALHEAGRTREAELAYRAVLAGRLERDERVHPETLAAWQSLALLLSVDGRAEEAGAMAAAATESYARLLRCRPPGDAARAGSASRLVRYTQGQFADGGRAAHVGAGGTGADARARRAGRRWRAGCYLARHAGADGPGRARPRPCCGGTWRWRRPAQDLEARTVLADLLFQQDRLTEALAEFTAVDRGGGRPRPTTRSRSRAAGQGRRCCSRWAGSPRRRRRTACTRRLPGRRPEQRPGAGCRWSTCAPRAGDAERPWSSCGRCSTSAGAGGAPDAPGHALRPGGARRRAADGRPARGGGRRCSTTRSRR